MTLCCHVSKSKLPLFCIDSSAAPRVPILTFASRSNHHGPAIGHGQRHRANSSRWDYRKRARHSILDKGGERRVSGPAQRGKDSYPQHRCNRPSKSFLINAQLGALRATTEQAVEILDECRSTEGGPQYDQTIADRAIVELQVLVTDFEQLVSSVQSKDHKNRGGSGKLSRSRWVMMKARPKGLETLRQRAKNSRELLILGFGALNSAHR